MTKYLKITTLLAGLIFSVGLSAEDGVAPSEKKKKVFREPTKAELKREAEAKKKEEARKAKEKKEELRKKKAEEKKKAAEANKKKSKKKAEEKSDKKSKMKPTESEKENFVRIIEIIDKYLLDIETDERIRFERNIKWKLLIMKIKENGCKKMTANKCRKTFNKYYEYYLKVCLSI